MSPTTHRRHSHTNVYYTSLHEGGLAFTTGAWQTRPKRTKRVSFITLVEELLSTGRAQRKSKALSRIMAAAHNIYRG